MNTKEPLTTLTPRLETVLRAFNHNQSRKANHCRTIARLYIDKQVTTPERDLLLLHTQALTGQLRKTVLQEYRECEEDYNKHLAEQEKAAKEAEEKDGD